MSPSVFSYISNLKCPRAFHAPTSWPIKFKWAWKKLFSTRHGWEVDVFKCFWNGWVMLYCLLQGDSGEWPPASGAPCGPQSMSFSHLRKHSTQHDLGSIISNLTHETDLLGGWCAFDRADSHPGEEKNTLGAITFKSSISLSTVKPLHCNLARKDIIKALFLTPTLSVAFRTLLFCLINAQLLISVFRCC